VYRRGVARFQLAPVVVTGASGNTGRPLVQALGDLGVPVRVAGTAPERLRGLFPAAEAVRLDLRDPATFGPAVRGARGLFLVRPPAVSDVGPTLNRLVDVARAEGVSHLVFLSVAGAGANPLVPHHAVERHLAAGTADWTLLRPGFFAQNLGDAYRRDLLEDDRLYVPAGRGRAAFVDVRDVAEVAARALQSPAEHAGRAWTLTGPEALSFDEAARLLTAALGRPIRYEAASVPGYARHLRARGLPWGQVAVQAVLHVGLRLGQAAAVDPTLPRLLGRPARTLADYVRDHAGLWRRG
jgi:uncharacterized protein YbjT (DUF2867 family)